MSRSHHHYEYGADRFECPFFKEYNSNSILCEGCEDNSSVRQTFTKKEGRIQWANDYCFSIKTCPDCPIYELANKKYE